MDPQEFDALVHATIQRQFGAPLEVVARDPELREALYDAVSTALRRPKRPIPSDSLEFAARVNASGRHISPGTSDLSHLPEPAELGWSLSDAIIEYRRAGL